VISATALGSHDVFWCGWTLVFVTEENFVAAQAAIIIVFVLQSETHIVRAWQHMYDFSCRVVVVYIL